HRRADPALRHPAQHAQYVTMRSGETGLVRDLRSTPPVTNSKWREPAVATMPGSAAATSRSIASIERLCSTGNAPPSVRYSSLRETRMPTWRASTLERYVSASDCARERTSSYVRSLENEKGREANLPALVVCRSLAI